MTTHILMAPHGWEPEKTGENVLQFMARKLEERHGPLPQGPATAKENT